jgi:hypothetical protein
MAVTALVPHPNDPTQNPVDLTGFGHTFIYLPYPPLRPPVRGARMRDRC